LLFTLSFTSIFADTSGDLSVVFGKTYQIHYEAKDSQIHSVVVNKESQSLVFSVSATSGIASIQLTLPRELIDATQSDGADDKFIILVDGTFAAETETNPSSLTRTILIPLTVDSKEVEIIGTHLGGISNIKNNTTLIPSPTIIPEKPVEQKPIEKKTSQQSSNSSSLSQPKQSPYQAKSVQEQFLQQITSLLHFKSGYLPIDVGKKQIVEYSIIISIVLVIIIAIASSARSKRKKSIRK
jgi:hypothetical protein